jgi:hypothetical protein
MALMQLVANGYENTTLNIPPTLSTEYFTHEFSNNTLIMLRHCDTKCPEYLEIELNPNIDRNNFKNVCHKVCFEMEIGGQIILSIPLRFMMHLKDYEICDNKFYVSIPFKMFCDDIKAICLGFHQLIFKLTNTENNFMSCKLITKGIYYDAQIRREMANNSHQHIIQQLASTELTCSNDRRNEFMYRMQFTSIHKGFFIESENVDEINEIKLQLNGHDRSHYNRFLVRTKCVKINQQLLYFPLNYDKSYTDRTTQGFEGSLNLSRIDLAKLYIKLDNPQSKICIYGLGSNMLRYSSGMGGLAFDSGNRHVYEEYNEAGIYAYVEGPIQSTVQAPIINENIIYKPITNNEKVTCCITQEDISVNARYMSCSQCSNNFDESSIKSWFRQRPHRKKCPMCRVDWTDFNIYINGEEPEPGQIEEPEILDPPTTT